MSERVRSRSLDDIIGLALIIGAIVVGYRILVPLMPSILWGGALAVICARPFEAVSNRLGARRSLAVLLFGLIYLFALICPAIFFAWELLRTAPSLLHMLQSFSEHPESLQLPWLADVPLVGPDLALWWATATTDVSLLEQTGVRHLGQVAGWAAAQIGTFGAFVVQFALGAVIALFLLAHRSHIRGYISGVLERVGGDFARGVAANAFNTMRTAFFGVIVSATAQAILASVALWLVGLPNIILFMGLTFLASLIQIGPIVTLVVADCILILSGDHMGALLVTIWFLSVVMTCDNFIKPYFTQRGAALPGLLAFLGGIGGILSWGLIGAYLGPALMSVLYQLALAWGTQGVKPQPSPASAPQE